MPDPTCPLCSMDEVLCLAEGDHEIDCRMNGLSIALKACYVKKVTK